MQTRLPSCREVAENLESIRGAAQVWINPEETWQKKVSLLHLYKSHCPKNPFYARWTLTIIKLVLTVEQILADTSRVLPRSQRLFDALDHGAEVTERLEDLHVLVW